MPHEIVSFDEEADQLVNAGRYERTDERQAYRSGHYRRRLVTGAGELELSVPKLMYCFT